MSTTTSLLPGQLYHIYNRGNNRENLFREMRNYDYFMRRYASHLGPLVQTHAYCLLRNKFFSNFFNAYARAVNKACTRVPAPVQMPSRDRGESLPPLGGLYSSQSGQAWLCG